MTDVPVAGPNPVQADITPGSFISVATIYIPVFAICLLAFSILQRHHHTFFSPNCKFKREGGLIPTPPDSYWGWFMATMDYTDPRLLKTHGADAVTYSLFLKFAIFLLCAMGLVGLVIMMPVNFTADQTGISHEKINSGLQRFTISNIPNGSDRLYLHLLAEVFFTLMIYAMLYFWYRKYFHMRQRHNQMPHVEHYSVIVTKIPRSRNLDRFVESLFPGQIMNHTIAMDTAELDRLYKTRKHLIRRLDRAQGEYELSGERPQRKVWWGSRYPGLGLLRTCFGENTDTIMHLTRRLADTAEAIEAVQKEEMTPTSTGFVTFHTKRAAVLCSQSNLSANENTFNVGPAPEPRDIIWPNLKHNDAVRHVRTVMTMMFLVVIIFFWSIPVAFVVGLYNIQRLQKIALFRPLADFLTRHPALNSIIEGALPSLTLVIFNGLLPHIIRVIEKYRLPTTRSRLRQNRTEAHYAFLVLNTFIITTLGSSLLSQLEILLNNPSLSYITTILAAGIPGQAILFTNYILTQGLVTFALQLLRPVDFGQYLVLRRFYCKTDAEVRRAATFGTFDYSTRYAQEMLILTIAIVYSHIAPMVLPYALLYFCMAYTINRYNVIYVFPRKYEGGGLIWSTIVAIIFVALLIYQLMMSGIYLLYKFESGGFALALPIITIFYWRYLHVKFYRRSRYLALELCPTEADDTGRDREQYWYEAYKQPALRPPGMYIRAALADYSAEQFSPRGRIVNADEDLMNGHIPRRTPHSSEESTPEEIEPDEADERSGLLSPANSQPPA